LSPNTKAPLGLPTILWYPQVEDNPLQRLQQCNAFWNCWCNGSRNCCGKYSNWLHWQNFQSDRRSPCVPKVHSLLDWNLQQKYAE